MRGRKGEKKIGVGRNMEKGNREGTKRRKKKKGKR